MRSMDLNELSEEKRQRIHGMLRGGQKIAAIKLVREETGTGLKEAKDAVDAYASSLGIESKSSGCLVVLFLIGGGLLAALA